MEQFDASYAARFGNFSGMTFYSNGSQRAEYQNALQGRSSRLHEFITEFTE